MHRVSRHTRAGPIQSQHLVPSVDPELAVSDDGPRSRLCTTIRTVHPLLTPAAMGSQDIVCLDALQRALLYDTVQFDGIVESRAQRRAVEHV